MSQSDVNDTLHAVAGVGLTKHTLGYNTVLLQIGLGHCGSCNAQDLMGGGGGGFLFEGLGTESITLRLQRTRKVGVGAGKGGIQPYKL